MHRFLPLFPASRGDFNALGAWWQTVYNIICTFIFRLDVSHLPLSPRSESRHLSLTAPSLPPTPLSLIQYPKQAEGEEERNPRPSNPMGETDRQHLLRPSSSSSSLCASDPQRAKAHPCIHALTYTHKQRDRPTPDRPGLLAHMLSPLSLLPSLFLSHKTGLRREGEGEGGRQQTPPFDWSRGTQHRWIQKREREEAYHARRHHCDTKKSFSCHHLSPSLSPCLPYVDHGGAWSDEVLDESPASLN